MLDRLRRLFDRLGKLGTTAIGIVIWEIGARVSLPGLNGKVLSDFTQEHASERGHAWSRLHIIAP